MTGAHIRQVVKPLMLPIAMVGGVLLHQWLGRLQPVVPWLIFAMLVITFCKVNPRDLRPHRITVYLLLCQIGVAMGVYWAVLPLSHDLAAGMMICAFAPTASAAPAVVGMLGGSIPVLVTFSLVSNLCVALLAPLVLTMNNYVGGDAGVAAPAFFDVFLPILGKILPLILGPLLVAVTLRRVAPRVHKALATWQSLSFYLWCAAIFITVGLAVSFIISEPAALIPEMIALALGAAVVCVVLFVIGRRIGRRYGQRVAAAQGLAQKNTVLVLWMALTFMHPVTSVAPAAYVAWQNIVNSWQLWRHSAVSSRKAR